MRQRDLEVYAIRRSNGQYTGRYAVGVEQVRRSGGRATRKSFPWVFWVCNLIVSAWCGLSWAG